MRLHLYFLSSYRDSMSVFFFFLCVFVLFFFTIFQKIFLSSLDKCVVIVLTTFTLALMRWQSGEHLYDTVRDAS